jgi:hypothetical protein
MGSINAVLNFSYYYKEFPTKCKENTKLMIKDHQMRVKMD